MSSTYSLDDLPRHQSGSLSASQAFLNWTEFVSIGCIYTAIYDPQCEDRVNFSQASSRTVYSIYVSGNLGFRAAPICAVQETALRSCKKGGHGQLCQPGPKSSPYSLSSVPLCQQVCASVNVNVNVCFCQVDSLLLENVIALSVFHLLQIW